ncbi:hypothetical protein AB0L65_40385 [Nonomuraea sp. NPDC052116]|uniref:hypothetical protein n=1 Tax=Nonomuraea sp. NPDC052116 TaxID=3155665 RepID=UPI00342E2A9D
MSETSHPDYLRRIAALAAATATAVAALTAGAAAFADTDHSALGTAIDRVTSDDVVYKPARQFNS